MNRLKYSTPCCWSGPLSDALSTEGSDSARERTDALSGEFFHPARKEEFYCG
ncbi:MAG: hypothetical protein ACOC44_16965 [Promethearchaeia archaeon]